MPSLVTAINVCLCWTILCLSDGSSVSVHLPAPSNLFNRALNKKLRSNEEPKLHNVSVFDNKILNTERTSLMDSSKRDSDNFSRVKSPIVAAFLTPLTASISAVRHSVETVSSGVKRCSAVAHANPIRVPFFPPRKASSEAEAALKTNPTQDAGSCSRHVVRRSVTIHARYALLPDT
jgi:hypothetical protein